MVITKTQIYYFLIALCILLQNRFFHFANASSTLTMLLIVVIIIGFLMAISDKDGSDINWPFRYMMVLFAVVIVPQTIYAFSQGETIDGYIDTIRGLLNILLLLPVLKYAYQKDSIKGVLDLIAVLTTVTLGFLLINSFMLNNFGVQVFPFDYYAMPDTARGDRLRIYLTSDFAAFVSIYAFCRLLKRESRNVWYLIAFAVCFTDTIYIEQTRAMYFTIIVSCILALAQTIGDRKKLLYIIAFFVFLIGMMGDWFNAFFALFSVDNPELGVSTAIRIAEYQYSLDLILEHPILGTGMVSDYLFYTVKNGLAIEYNHTDIGIIGCISYIGLIGTIVLFLWPFLRIVKSLRLCPASERESFEYCFMFGICIYLTVTMLTLLITDNSRIFAWPFILATSEFIRNKWIMQDYEFEGALEYEPSE